VVTADVPAFAIVTGNPARISGYAAIQRKGALRPRHAAPGRLRVRGARVVSLTEAVDLRGRLVAAERQLPFSPRRVVAVFDVPSKEVRGERAYRRQRQFIVCLRGSCSLLLDDGREREELVLDDPARGVSVPPLVWTSFFRHSPDALVLVLSDRGYDPAEYLRDYEEFRRLVAARRGPPRGRRTGRGRVSVRRTRPTG